jgi:hypothetical protein
MPITIYDIKNCDTMKKARAWLEQHGADYAFHDEKSADVTAPNPSASGPPAPNRAADLHLKAL